MPDKLVRDLQTLMGTFDFMAFHASSRKIQQVGVMGSGLASTLFVVRCSSAQ